jgi:hypothetical protein
MRQRLSRRTWRAALPPDQLKAKAAQLRQAVPNNSRVIAVCNAIEELIADGYTLREYDGPQPRRAELLPEWKGREPPEKP